MKIINGNNIIDLNEFKIKSDVVELGNYYRDKEYKTPNYISLIDYIGDLTSDDFTNEDSKISFSLSTNLNHKLEYNIEMLRFGSNKIKDLKVYIS